MSATTHILPVLIPTTMVGLEMLALAEMESPDYSTLDAEDMRAILRTIRPSFRFVAEVRDGADDAESIIAVPAAMQEYMLNYDAAASYDPWEGI